MGGMSRRCLSIAVAATWLLAACPGPARPVPPLAVAADTALRIRIAQAEARRAGGTAELVELARGGDRPARLLALRGLGRIGSLGAAGGGLDALTAALGDPDPEVVGAAAAAIGVAASLDDDRELGAPGASDALVRALPRAGRPGIEALGRAGTAATQPMLVTALGDPALAELAGLALGRHGRRKIALGEPARQALVAASASGDPAVRYAAVYALSREHQPPDHPASVAALVGRLGDPVAEIRAQAIAGLGRRKAGAAAGAAGARLLLDRDWRVAAEAVRALADSDDGKDAIAAAIVRRFDELLRTATGASAPRENIGGDPAAAQVILEGERVLAGAAGRPVVAAALSSLASRAPAASGLPALTRGWIGCLAIAALQRARPDADPDAIARCELADPLRLPLIAALIDAGAGSLATRRAALARLLGHPDARVRAAGLGALAAMWKAGDAGDRARATAALIGALAGRELDVAGAAVDAATAIYDATDDGDRGSLAPLDAAVVARARTERDPELGAALLPLIGKRRLPGGAGACRGALDGDPVRARAAIACLEALGEPGTSKSAAAPAPPVDLSAVIGNALRWRLTTTRGEIVIALRPDVAPWAVAAIVALTRRGFYDGIAFHRVVPDFVVQGGDPTESGSGGPGFALPAEPATLLDGAGYRAGGVGIADAGRDTGGSQWFVMHSRAPHLDGRYTWIGTVESGQAAADALVIGDRVVRAAIDVGR